MNRVMMMVGASFLATTLSCGQSNQAVRSDETGAEGQRQLAQKESTAADRAVREASSPPQEPNLSASAGNNPQGYYFDVKVYDARGERLARASELREHARQHEAAAASLEKFEEAECKQFPASTRSACPLLGPVVAIEDVPAGVRVKLESGTRADAVLAHMRCHLAFAQARGFGAAASCPLYVRGIDIRAGSAPATIDIVGSDAKVVDEIRSRTRQEAILVRASAPGPATD